MFNVVYVFPKVNTTLDPAASTLSRLLMIWNRKRQRHRQQPKTRQFGPTKRPVYLHTSSFTARGLPDPSALRMRLNRGFRENGKQKKSGVE